MEEITIRCVGSAPALKLAARELRRVLSRVAGVPVSVRAARHYQAGEPGIWLGTISDLALPETRGNDPQLDDEVAIRVAAGQGYIAGSNERSVLFAVYRYLAELGCRWMRPGRTGEYLPNLGPELPSVTVRETASYRHRGVCIEGAVSWQHVRDMVDWLPKLGFNAYFIQFREAYNFFQRWYEHEYNPRWPRQRFTVEEARELTRRLRAEAKRRGLLLHMVGHGWTCEPFGIPGPGWFPHEGPVPPEAVQHLAELHGKRELFGNIALNTNLCYGNPETRDIVTDAIVAYARENPDVDLIHFWLADGSNNQCECPRCRNHRPADLYVRMLNELDVKLTRAGLATRIVFLAYVDLLWPPERERLRNQDRFVLMFAPITRSYSTSFTDAQAGTVKLPPFRRNRLRFPSDPALNLGFLKAWQAQFAGDSFDFDYHFMWDHYKDPAQYALARVLHRDVQGLRSIGLNGLMSCQVQRVSFPTGLGMTVLGRTLWNRRLSLESIATDHLRGAFGEGSEFVRGYLKTLSRLFDARVIRGEASETEIAAARERWRAIPGVVDGAQEAIRRGLQSANPCHVRSWRLLGEFGQLCKRLSVALVAKHGAPPEEARAAAWEVVSWARRAERRFHGVWDVYEFLQTIGGYLGLTGEDLSAR